MQLIDYYYYYYDDFIQFFFFTFERRDCYARLPYSPPGYPTSLYSVSHSLFATGSAPYIYNISYKRNLACTYFKNQSNKLFFFL